MKSPKMVYLVRHGQSEDNTSPVFQTYDSPLSKKGKDQAKALAERFRHVTFDIVVSSPQERAKATAEAIADASAKEVVTSDLFIERVKPTSIDGKPWEDEKAHATWREWEKSLRTPNYRIENGENYDDIVARADKALAYLEARSEDSLVVVSHGHFIRTILARVLLGDELTGVTLKRFYELAQLENTGITALRYKDAYEEDFRWRLWTFNDHAHFAE